MVILHIASINDNLCSGVSVVVPQHLKYQSLYAKLAFINLEDYRLSGIEQYSINTASEIELLPNPFNKPDIVVFHEIYFFKYISIANYLKIKKIPYIIIPHGGLTETAQGIKPIKKRIGNLLFFNSFIKGASALQMLSAYEQKTTSYENKKFIGTNGIELPELYKKHFNNDKINFVYVGRLDIYHKGLDLMIKAFGENHDLLSKNNAVLNIYGPLDFLTKKELINIIHREKVSDIVKINGAVTGKEKVDILLKSDVFIQTSRFEGMPMGILEALSYGVPCFVTEGTTLDNLISMENAGWSSKTELSDISDNLKNMIDSKINYLEKSNNARKLIKKYFLWENISKLNIESYQNVINEYCK